MVGFTGTFTYGGAAACGLVVPVLGHVVGGLFGGLIGYTIGDALDTEIVKTFKKLAKDTFMEPEILK